MKEIALTTEKWFEPEVTRIAGEIALKSPKGKATAAGTFFERALTLAQDSGCQIMGIARCDEPGPLLARPGEAGGCPELLGTVCGWFSEGFETLDLREAMLF